MSRLIAGWSALLGLLLAPLALTGLTAWLLIPAHALLTTVASTMPLLEGWDGRPERARWWAIGYLLASLWMVLALEIGATVSGQGWMHWGVPWISALLWGWIPPLAAGAGSWLGTVRRDQLSRRAIRRRKRAAMG